MTALAFALALLFGIGAPEQPTEYASFDVVCATDAECLALYQGIPCWGDEENLLDTDTCEVTR